MRYSSTIMFMQSIAKELFIFEVCCHILHDFNWYQEMNVEWNPFILMLSIFSAWGGTWKNKGEFWVFETSYTASCSLSKENEWNIQGREEYHFPPTAHSDSLYCQCVGYPERHQWHCLCTDQVNTRLYVINCITDREMFVFHNINVCQENLSSRLLQTIALRTLYIIYM